MRLSVFCRKPASIRRRKWILAEGADAAGMSRSIPLAKAMDDALIALYQNGEARAAIERLSDAAAVAGI